MDLFAYRAGQKSGGGGTDNYNALSNLPQINSVTLTGNKSADDLGLASKDDISAVYRAAGQKSCAELLPALLVEGNIGRVYNVSDSGTTTANFVEGAGHAIIAGDNVVVVDIGTENDPDIKFDKLSGIIVNTDTYSTTETLTNKIWIDGKPIYRKVVVKNSADYIAEGGWKAVSSESWLANVDNLITAQVQGKEVGGIPFAPEGINFHVKNGALEYYVFHYYEMAAGSNIILEYTKTTD